MTGGEGDGSPLRVCFEHPGEEELISPDGWPGQMPLPMPGEPVASYLARAIAGDPFFQSVITRMAGLVAPSLGLVRPFLHTFEWWAKKWSDGGPVVPLWVFGAPARRDALAYHVNRIHWRLVVEWLDRWEGGHLRMRGLRMDTPSPSLEEAVDAGYRRNRYMIMRPRDGSFEPEPWHQRQPPAGLPWYGELTLWPAEADEAKQKKKKSRGELLADALVARHKRGLSILSPGMSVDELHTEIREETNIKVAGATFERALKAARERCSGD